MRSLFLVLIFVSSWSNLFGQSNELGDLTLIGNKIDSKTMKKNSVLNVFKGRLDSWNNGLTVIVVLPSQKNENSTEVAKIIYGTTVKGMQKFWLSLVFQGRSKPPVFLDSDEEIIRFVQKNPGSIGLINKKSDSPENLQIGVNK